MEEENRKGPGVFYAVVGVATLVVAIIGATFAYFSASANTDEGAINGETVNVSATNLSITAEKVAFNGAVVTNPNLAPALVGSNGIANPDALTAAQVQAMVNARCEDATNNYTGCHVWKITATNNGTDVLTSANIWLTLSVTATNTDQWGYAVFTSDGNVATAGTTALNDVAYATVGGSRANHDDLGTAVTGTTLDLHNGAALAAGSANAAVYYLMVFLNDNKAVQNASGEVTGTNAVGSYSGAVSLEAMGGQVRASFTVA